MSASELPATFDLWLCCAGPRGLEYRPLGDGEGVPPGVALYPSRASAKQAQREALRHPSRPLPEGLQPIAVYAGRPSDSRPVARPEVAAPLTSEADGRTICG